MRKLALLCASLCAMTLVVPLTPALATNARSWVSPTGSDSNTCTEAAPCATFVGALAKTTAGGEIDCLASGDYTGSGPLTITGSITIDCGTGNVGTLELAPSGSVIVINVSGTANVVLRHLSINGMGTSGNNGITTSAFGSGQLVIDQCVITGFQVSGLFSGLGVLFVPSGASGSRTTLAITTTNIYGNTSGVGVITSSGQIASTIFLGDQISQNGGTGLALGGGGVVAGDMRQSVVAANGVDGINAGATGGTYFTVEGSTIIDNLSIGIVTTASAAIVDVGGSTIGGNGTGVSAGSGALNSFGNNQMSANGMNGTFSSTIGLQ